MRSVISGLLACAVAFGGGAAWAESRAVVIANAAYDGLAGVPGADSAEAVAAYKASGFRVVEGYDLPSGEIRRALSDLLRADPQPGPRIVTLIGRFAHSASESWFLGREAGTETLTGVDGKGVSLSVVMDLMSGGQPRSVLLLGTDDRAFATGAGLRHSLGEISAPEGVTVIAGYSQGIARAAAILARPGATVEQALAAGPSLRIMAGPGAPRPSQGEGEAAAWQRASSLNTAAGWREYLSKYPDGAHAAAVRERLGAAPPPIAVPPRPEDVARPPDEEMAAWSRAKRANTVAAYREFLDKHPTSLFAGAARGRMAELTAPESADPAATAEAALSLERGQRAQIQRQLTLLTYDTGGIDGIFGPGTRRAIARWQRNSGAAPTGFLTAPQIDLIRRSAAEKGAALEAQARARQAATEAADHAYWKETGQSGREADLRAYLQRYPSGLHSDRARDLLAERREGLDREPAAWARAVALNSVAGYRDYLERFPKGAHAREARQAADALRRRTDDDARAEAALDLNGAVLQAVEARLNQLGLDAGKADGRLDAQSRQALRRFQASRNLRASGYLNQATLVRLLADSLLRGN